MQYLHLVYKKNKKYPKDTYFSKIKPIINTFIFRCKHWLWACPNFFQTLIYNTYIIWNEC